jgi:hypothetical protein
MELKTIQRFFNAANFGVGVLEVSAAGAARSTSWDSE